MSELFGPLFCVSILTLKDPFISERAFTKIKIKLNFYFHTSLRCLKRFYEGFKTLKDPFISERLFTEIKIELNFILTLLCGASEVL